MKRLLVAAMLASGLALSGCQSFGARAAQTVTVINTAKYDATVLVTAAYQAQKAAADSLKFAADNGLIHGQSAATAKRYLDESLVMIQKADQDVALGKNVASELGNAYAFLAKATSMTPTAKGS